MNWLIKKTKLYLGLLIESGNLFYVLFVLNIGIFLFFIMHSFNQDILSNSLLGKNALYIPVELYYKTKTKNNHNFKHNKIISEDIIKEQSVDSTGSEGSIKDSYIAKVLSKIEKNKRYPKLELLMEKEGFVKVYIHLDKYGNILELKVLKGTNENFIKEAIRSIEVSAPFDPLPSELKNHFEFTLNLNYILQ